MPDVHGPRYDFKVLDAVVCFVAVFVIGLDPIIGVGVATANRRDLANERLCYNSVNKDRQRSVIAAQGDKHVAFLVLTLAN